MSSSLMQNRGNKTTARLGAAVSRKLRTAGWNISPNARKYNYDGIFVSAQGTSISVMVDLGVLAKNIETAAQIAATLKSWGNVGDVRASQVDGSHVWFVRGTYLV